MSAGLLLVAALHVGGSADGLAVGNLGRFERDIHAVTLLQAADSDLHVLLTGAGDQKFLGLRVAVETEGKIFLQQFVESVPHAVFVAAAFRFHGERDGRLGQFDGGELNLGRFLRERIAGQRVFEFGDGADIPGVQFIHGDHVFALGRADVSEAFLGAFAGDDQVRVILDAAGEDAEKGEASGEGIGSRLKDEGGGGLGVFGFALDFLPVQGEFGGGAVGGGGECFHDEIEQPVGTDVVQAGHTEDREDAELTHFLIHSADDVFFGQGAHLEELLHQFVLAFGDHFDQFGMRFLRGFGVFGGNGGFLALAVAVDGIDISLHPDQVDDATEVFVGAEGKLNGNRRAAEAFMDAFHGALETGAVTVQLIDDNGAGKAELLGGLPHLLGLRFHAGDGVDDDDSGIGGDQGGPGVVDKHVEPGRIEEVDLGLPPFGRRYGGGDRELAVDLFLVKVRYGISFVDPRQARGGACRIKQTGHYGGLPAVAVAYNADVSDVLRFVCLHGMPPFTTGIVSHLKQSGAQGREPAG